MKGVLQFLVVVTALSVGTGVIFSLSYWGYAWSPPAIDSRAQKASWTSISSFKSNLSGAEWRREDRDVRPGADEEASSDCCAIDRIVKFARGAEFAALTQEEVTALEGEALSLVELETGEPGYAAKRLYGTLALGADEDGQPIAFASFFGGEVSNDHYPMYELLWRRGPSPRLLSSEKYYGDIAGIEGLDAAGVATMLFVPFGAVALAVVQLLRARESALSRRTE